jgi:hypothetical protein
MHLGGVKENSSTHPSSRGRSVSSLGRPDFCSLSSHMDIILTLLLSKLAGIFVFFLFPLPSHYNLGNHLFIFFLFQ